MGAIKSGWCIRVGRVTPCAPWVVVRQAAAADCPPYLQKHPLLIAPRGEWGLINTGCCIEGWGRSRHSARLAEVLRRLVRAVVRVSTVIKSGLGVPRLRGSSARTA